jgi:hypothetical protein
MGAAFFYFKAPLQRIDEPGLSSGVVAHFKPSVGLSGVVALS